MDHHRTLNKRIVPGSQRTGELREVADSLQIVSKGKLQTVKKDEMSVSLKRKEYRFQLFYVEDELYQAQNKKGNKWRYESIKTIKGIWQRPTLPRIHSAVPSALEGLTSGFGMEPGVPPPLLPPDTFHISNFLCCSRFIIQKILQLRMSHVTKSIYRSKLRPQQKI